MHWRRVTWTCDANTYLWSSKLSTKWTPGYDQHMPFADYTLAFKLQALYPIINYSHLLGYCLVRQSACRGMYWMLLALAQGFVLVRTASVGPGCWKLSSTNDTPDNKRIVLVAEIDMLAHHLVRGFDMIRCHFRNEIAGNKKLKFEILKDSITSTYPLEVARLIILLLAEAGSSTLPHGSSCKMTRLMAKCQYIVGI